MRCGAPSATTSNINTAFSPTHKTMTDKTTTETGTLEDALDRLPPTVTPPGMPQDYHGLHIGRIGTNDPSWWICYERNGVMTHRFYFEGEDLHHLANEMYAELDDAGWL